MKRASRCYLNSYSNKAFTIVELLVVITIIAILMAITLVTYRGVSQKTVLASLQADLSNSTTLLKNYSIVYGSFPTSLDENNCPSAPNIDSNYCLKASSSNIYKRYTGTKSSFSFVNNNGDYSCIVSENTSAVCGQVNTLVIQPDATIGKDTYLWSRAPWMYWTWGSDTKLIVGHGHYTDVGTGGRPVIQFPVSDIPAGANITDAVLSLYEYEAIDNSVTPIGPWEVNLHRVTKSWTEAEATWYAVANANWATVGCGGDGTDRVATPSANLSLDGSSANGYVNWSNIGMVADVQDWVDGSAVNYGWILQAPTAEALGASSNLAYNSFYSSDYGTSSKRPKLTIEYIITLP